MTLTKPGPRWKTPIWLLTNEGTGFLFLDLLACASSRLIGNSRIHNTIGLEIEISHAYSKENLWDNSPAEKVD